MSTRLTASVVVCAASAAFAAAALIVNPEPARTSVAAAPVVVDGASTLSIQDFAFAAITAAPGSTVTVANLDGEAHTVTADDGSFDQTVDAGASATFTAPATPGTYSYVCAIHPSMHGQLVVA